MRLADGLTYHTFRAHDSQVHFLEVDLRERQVRPVMGAEAFPLLRTYPIHDAVEQGALACIGDGFNVVWFMNLGFADQPSHVTVVDGELWTTGRKGGGVGLQIGDGFATVAQNHVQVRLWQKGRAIPVENVNFGHDGKVNAFTPRGGTNQVPDPTKHLLQIGTTTFESRWRLPFDDGPIHWTQTLGEFDHVVSGWPQIVTAGENVVPFLNMDPEAPHGPDNWFVRRNPRQSMGTSEDGRTIYFVTVEGRIPTSRGVRLKQLAHILVNHGVYNAVNSDGGGSAYMWTRKQGLAADSCYGDGTISGLRPDHYAVAVF